MSRTHFDQDYFEFFIGLTLNNHKQWFDENRGTYTKEMKPMFEDFVNTLISELQKVSPDFNGINAKDCMFRINRDIRFSKDKTPYKTFFSASIHQNGRKAMNPGGMYLEIGPENCAIYSGAYMPEKEALQKIRSNIYHNLEEFDQIINNKKFKNVFGEIHGEKNKRIEKEFMGVAEKQPLILNKQFYIFHKFEPEDTMKPEFLNNLIEVWKLTKDLNDFLKR